MRVTRAEFLESCDDNGGPSLPESSIWRIAGPCRYAGGPEASRWVSTSAEHGRSSAFAYPPASRFGQVLHPEFGRRVSEEVVEQLWEEAEQTGLFRSTGKRMTCSLTTRWTLLVAWCESVEQAIRDPRTRPEGGCRTAAALVAEFPVINTAAPTFVIRRSVRAKTRSR